MVAVTPAEIIKAVYNAGIVGAGGAGFPTHVKLKAKADVVIGNGVECEPLLYHDKHLMEDKAGLVLKGMRLAMTATGASRGFIAVKKKYQKAIAALQKVIKPKENITVFFMPDYYPAGDEQEIVREVTGKRVPPGKIPLSVGVVVSNVTTLSQIALSIQGKPVINRNISIVGEVLNPCTVSVPIGISVQEVLLKTGNDIDESKRILSGGIMMGKIIQKSEPITKTTTALVVLAASHPRFNEFDETLVTIKKKAISVCCQCQSCMDICPRFLLGHPLSPNKNMRSFIALGFVPSSAALCCECGLCTYLVACPMNISPRRIHQIKKNDMMQKGIKPITDWVMKDEHPLRTSRRISSKRLKKKLGILNLDLEPKRFKGRFRPKSLKISLKQHIGKIAEPTIKVGEKVKKGSLIGKIDKNVVGSNLHSPINGIIDKIDSQYITIKT